jgi:hypothetical protein
VHVHSCKPTAAPLDPFQRWMVRTNLRLIATGETTAEEIVGVLRHNGYVRVADAVAEAVC